MYDARWFTALLAALLIGMSNTSSSAERPRGMATKEELSLRGSWYSTSGSLTFRNNGTVTYKGKRYYYAVSNGGLIQLTGRHSSNAIPYRVVGGKLVLTDGGVSTVYSRRQTAAK